ncbi:MAG: hypothetical protein RMJ87_07655 [Cytophagales bacterium]|nr:hypothetical protein [Bernardetiaceae bacterium]MDW8204888.1 hypothetical protein [Cytophagales bacterium]
MQKYLWILLIGMVTLGGATSCKNKQKIAEQQAREAKARQAAQAKSELQALLNDSGKSIEEREQALNRIKAQNIDDPEVQALIRQLEAKIAAEKAARQEEARRRAEEEQRQREEEARRKAEVAKALTIQDYFRDIVGSGNTATANNRIQEALQLFASPDTPVLIVIGVFNGEKDYDRPTTISKYLNYLKDQKKAPHRIVNIKRNAAGKIEELELELQK